MILRGWEGNEGVKDEYSMNRMNRILRRKGWEGYEGGKDEYSMNTEQDKKDTKEERMSRVWTEWEGYEGVKDEYSMNRIRRIWRRKGWV